MRSGGTGQFHGCHAMLHVRMEDIGWFRQGAACPHPSGMRFIRREALETIISPEWGSIRKEQ